MEHDMNRQDLDQSRVVDEDFDESWTSDPNDYFNRFTREQIESG